jgi:tetrahydromethanopterin S-methyltransferase subunit F
MKLTTGVKWGLVAGLVVGVLAGVWHICPLCLYSTPL